MSIESRVISGGKIPMHVYKANTLSDEANAVNMRKWIYPSEKEGGRTASDHYVPTKNVNL